MGLGVRAAGGFGGHQRGQGGHQPGEQFGLPSQ
jgi:hypothetical protein